MTSSKRNIALASAGVLAILALGAGAGAGVYSSVAPTSTTTTVVRDVGSTGAIQNASDTSSAISVPAVYQRAHKGVVDIVVGQTHGTAEGSGWVYDLKGDIVTNEHVVSGATSITVTLWNGKSFKGHVVGTDSSTDLAVVRISAPVSMLSPLTVGDSGAVQVGSPVVAIGSPFGLAETVTSGIVSALGRTIDAPNNFTIANAIQTDAPINHGNSGGPLLSAAGQVIGVNAQIQSQSGGSEGVGFAIPSNTVRSVVSQLVAGKTVAHAYFGVQVSNSSSPLGAELAQVMPGTPAAKAGLKAGDVVVKLDGKAVQSADDVSSVMEAKKPGDVMKVTYVRGGKTAVATVTLATRPS
jgi:putative serine protease PepD